MCKWMSNKAFDGHDSAGKLRHVSLQHLQLLHLAEHVLIHLPEMTSFGRIMRYINQPNLIPNLHTPVNVQNKHKRKISLLIIQNILCNK